MIKISRKQTQEKENINKKCPTKWSVQQKQSVPKGAGRSRGLSSAVAYKFLIKLVTIYIYTHTHTVLTDKYSLILPA